MGADTLEIKETFMVFKSATSTFMRNAGDSSLNYCSPSTTPPCKHGVKVSFQTILTVPKCDSNPQIEGFGIPASFILLKWT